MAADWRQVAQILKRQIRPDDALRVEPAWARPLLLQAMGEKLSLAQLTRRHHFGVRRLWRVQRRDRSPTHPRVGKRELRVRRGQLVLERWPMRTPDLLFDFVEAFETAQVTRHVQRRTPAAAGAVSGGVAVSMEERCVWRVAGNPRGGGFEYGPLTPASRFVCDERAKDAWVGVQVQEDMRLRPHRCIRQAPQSDRTVWVRYAKVPHGTEISLDFGLFYLDEREARGAPIRFRLRVDGRTVRTLVHRDGTGVQHVQIPLPPSDQGTHDVALGVQPLPTARRDPRRSFCWSGQVIRRRAGVRQERPGKKVAL